MKGSFSIPNDAPEVRARLTADELARFEAFLAVRGAKKGPYTRQLILRAMEEAERRGESGFGAVVQTGRGA